MKTDRRKNNRGSVLISVLLIIVIVLAAGLIVALRYKSMQEEAAPVSAAAPAPTEEPAATPVPPTPEPTMSPEEIKALEEAERAEKEARKKEAAQYSFYQKLEKGYGANILILGDASITEEESNGIDGVVDGPLFRALTEKLLEKYPVTKGGTISTTNYACESGNLLYDAIRVNAMPEEPSFDLAILNYGLNEQKNDVLSNFDALIYALKKKFPDCSIICTIEPCFHGLPSELMTMSNASDTYGIPVINLFSTFYNKGYEAYFDYFDRSQTYLSEKGMEEWVRLLCEIIDTNVENSTGKMGDISMSSPIAEEVAELCFIPASDPRVSRKDDTSYTLDFKAKGLSYILHKEMIAKDDAKIVADGMLYSFGKPAGIETPEGDYLTLIYGDLRCENDFTITFTSKELADGLKGFYLIEKSEEKK